MEPERIAKYLARLGVASRRGVEDLIQQGRVTLNGKVLETPAVKVSDKDRILVDGKPPPEREKVRMWRYYKPTGLVTTARDEKGRETIFDHLPQSLPRVVTVGRLDLNSEGLLLLTNDGELKRKLELPSTGWSRRYRVRVNGKVNDEKLEPLRKGITVDGQKYLPMSVTLDRQQGANAWVSVTLKEGKNREIRRAMASIDLKVNRLIRVSYGPFQLEGLTQNDCVEVKSRVLKDQLGKML